MQNSCIKCRSLLFVALLVVFFSACSDNGSQAENDNDDGKVSSGTSTDEKNISEVKDGFLIDSRDGHKYKVVTIGNQTWMAENLNYAYLEPMYGNDSSSFCYNNDPSYCKKYGRLYLWDAAKDTAGRFNSNGNIVRGVCPLGWHLPTRDEWEELLLTTGGFSVAYRTLKSKTGWKDKKEPNDNNGTDDFGFSVLPAGLFSNIYDKKGVYEEEGEKAAFWFYTKRAIASPTPYFLFLKDDNVVYVIVSSKTYQQLKVSVRCLKDEPMENENLGKSKGKKGKTGIFTDSRDGKTYKTIHIGSQTWMAENMNYETGNSNCPLDSVGLCDEFGRHYGFSAAVDSACPVGWHLPSDHEWSVLFNEVGGVPIAGKMLKSSTDDWIYYDGARGGGSDAYGFTVLPAGEKDESVWRNAFFWSSTKMSNSNDAYVMGMSFIDDRVTVYTCGKNCTLSVRCVED